MSSTATNSSSPCCPPGSWDGTLNIDGPTPPRGTKITLNLPESNGELKAYYSAPPAATTKDDSQQQQQQLGVVVFHDVWGHIPRFLSICDTFAEQGGYHVIAPDCFRGKTKNDVEDMLGWLKSHPYDEMISKDIAACIEYLQKEKGVTRFGALGFCWGGWVIAKSSSSGAGIPWSVGVSPHPSLRLESLAFGRSESDMVAGVSMPFLLLPGGNDPDNTKPGGEHVMKLQEKGGKSIVFEDMVHGWTTRSDLTDPNTKKQVEKALSLSLDFMMEHLH